MEEVAAEAASPPLDSTTEAVSGVVEVVLFPLSVTGASDLTRMRKAWSKMTCVRIA